MPASGFLFLLTPFIKSQYDVKNASPVQGKHTPDCLGAISVAVGQRRGVSWSDDRHHARSLLRQGSLQVFQLGPIPTSEP